MVQKTARLQHARLAVLACCLFLSPILLAATTVGVYNNRADWVAAISLHGANALTTISFDDARWSSQIKALPMLTQNISQSDNAASDGSSIIAIAGYSAPGLIDNATLGHVAKGMWIDSLSKYGSTSFNFSKAIYGFGGDFDIAQSNGLFISTLGQVAQIDGFVGFITDHPIDSLLISWGQSGDCLRCFGNSYTLSSLEVASLPTPEPNYNYALAAIIILVAGYRASRSCWPLPGPEMQP